MKGFFNVNNSPLLKGLKSIKAKNKKQDRYDELQFKKSAKVSLLKEEIKAQTQTEFELKMDDLMASYKFLCLAYSHNSVVGKKQVKADNDQYLSRLAQGQKQGENLENLLDSMDDENAEEFTVPLDKLKTDYGHYEAKVEKLEEYEVSDKAKKAIREACYVLKKVTSYNFESYSPNFEEMNEEFLNEYLFILQSALELVKSLKSDKEVLKALSYFNFQEWEEEEKEEEEETTQDPFQGFRTSPQEIEDEAPEEEETSNVSSKGRRQRKSSKQMNS